MLFNSFPYIFLFLPLAALVYAIARRYVGNTSARAFLLLASLFFYGFNKPSNLPILITSVIFNWAVARVLGDTGLTAAKRQALFWAGLTANIALLFSFKYINFFLQSVAALHGPQLILPDLEFPLGISFFTLSQIMYLVDTYESPTTSSSLADLFSFVCFFPYLTSGPIARAADVIPQIKGELTQRDYWDLASRGLFLFALGLAKKVVFADSFANIADAGFKMTSQYSTVEAWAFCLAYSMQIYFDFSGYSDMALGSAMMLGVEIPVNFDAPFRSLSISEYWQRWHISLSRFITNYLYTPVLRLMGGRATLGKSAVAIIIAMTIAGIWHGPSWTYLVYGLVHGLALAINQIWKRRKIRMPAAASWLITFVFVNLSFVLFRSPSLAAAGHFYLYMLPQANILGTQVLRGVLPLTPVTLIKPVSIGLVAAFFFPTSTQLTENMPLQYSRAFATASLLLLSMFFLNSTAAKTFIYFAF